MSKPAAVTLTIVCLGASNTEGYGVAGPQSYPARLQGLLDERGVAARVLNAGISGDTTSGMLARLERAVPDGTRLVIFQPGINDLHMLPLREQNMAAIQARLAARGITVIMLDNSVLRALPASEQAADGIHLTAKGYAHVAEIMLPQVLKAIGQR